MTSVSKPNVENSHFLSKLARCRSPLAIMCHIWTLFCPICAEISFGSSTSERPHTALGISGTREGYSNKENLEGRSSNVLSLWFDLGCSLFKNLMTARRQLEYS